jgi:hypothetical protein
MTFWNDQPPAKPKKPPISVDEWLRTMLPLESYKTHRTILRYHRAEAEIFQRGDAA